MLAAAGPQLVDFSFRRTQGIEAGLAAARAAVIAGFAATSNTEAVRRYGLPAAGTMAHSFIEAFGSQQAALTAFRRGLPRQDHVPGGHLRHRARHPGVARRLRLAHPAGVRLGSGDLAAWRSWPAASSTPLACPVRGSSPAAVSTSTRSPAWRRAAPRSTPMGSAPRWDLR